MLVIYTLLVDSDYTVFILARHKGMKITRYFIKRERRALNSYGCRSYVQNCTGNVIMRRMISLSFWRECEFRLDVISGYQAFYVL